MSPEQAKALIVRLRRQAKMHGNAAQTGEYHTIYMAAARELRQQAREIEMRMWPR